MKKLTAILTIIILFLTSILVNAEPLTPTASSKEKSNITTTQQNVLNNEGSLKSARTTSRSFSDDQVIEKSKQYLKDLFKDEAANQKTNFKINNDVTIVYDIYDNFDGYMVSISNDTNQEIGTMYITEINGKLVLEEGTVHESIAKKYKDKVKQMKLSKDNSQNVDNHKLIKVSTFEYMVKNEVNTKSLLPSEEYFDLRRNKDATNEIKEVKRIRKDAIDKSKANSQTPKINSNKSGESTSGNSSTVSNLATSTYAIPHTSASLRNSFNLINNAYGGDQTWFSAVYPKGTSGDYQNSVGCGPTSAANITAYYSKYYSSMKNLYSGSSWDIYSFSQHMDKLFYYGPARFEILPDYLSMIKNYASSRGISLDAHTASAYFTYANGDFANLCSNIKEGIARNAPVALLMGPGSEIYDPDTGSYVVVSGELKYQNGFTNHWVTITAYNFAYDDTTLATVSSWGLPYILNLSALIDKRSFLDTAWFTSGSYTDYDPIQLRYYIESGTFNSQSEAQGAIDKYLTSKGLWGEVKYYFKSGTFSLRSQAQAIVDEMARDGLWAEVIVDGSYYRVSSGTFNSESATQSAIDKYFTSKGLWAAVKYFFRSGTFPLRYQAQAIVDEMSRDGLWAQVRQ